MTMSRRSLAALLALAFVLAGCGAKNEASSSLPAGGDFAPASTAVFVTSVTDPSSSQWQKADELLGHFPGREKLLASFRKELAADAPSWPETALVGRRTRGRRSATTSASCSSRTTTPTTTTSS